MAQKIIAIASDHAGIEFKQQLAQAIKDLGFDVHDLGTDTPESVDYPDFANALCEWVLKHPESKGVLICGSGIGMSIAANRHKGIRAALVHNGLEASLSRKHNDANVLCLGARMVGIEVAKDALKQFVTTEFEGGRHAKRIEKIG
jgi:ribose 5-phosphate isomerase B